MKLIEVRNMLLEIKKKKKHQKPQTCWMNIIVDSAEETMSKPEARSVEMIQCTARRNEVLENINIKEKRAMEGRIIKTRKNY